MIETLIEWLRLLSLIMAANVDLPAQPEDNCILQVNDLCYDQGSPALPPLTAKLKLMDAETGKGISDAWVSLRWYSRTLPNEYSPCVRSVLGRTDEEGWFSSVGKDGSWYFDDVHYLAPGYEELNFRGTREGRIETYVDIPQSKDLYYLGPWIRSLEDMGYRATDRNGASIRYSKWIALQQGFERRDNDLTKGQIKSILMGTWRTPPSDQVVHGSILPPCGDPGSDQIGYDGPDGFASAQRLMLVQNYQRLCDSRWFAFDSVALSVTGRALLQSTLQLHPQPDVLELLGEFAPAYGKALFKYPYTQATELNRSERTALCHAIEPYALPLPPPALEIDP